jgi:hypothetical protein
MSFIIREKWIWITIGLCILALVGPYAVMLMIFNMPEILRAPFVWCIILGWGVAAGFKDWLMDAKKREKNSRLPEQ